MTDGLGFPDLKPGEVWLTGAGPGDPGLLTLLARHALSQADAVVHDALIDGRLLALVREGAQIVDMGKRGGRPSPKQSEINSKLVELARQGLRVVRLKGGDPFVFGRGAEEALGLAEAGIPFRIVPGVTAAVGGLGMAGLPLTSRDISFVTLATGHGPDGNLPADLDWNALAKAPVLAIYMGLRNLPEIAARLIAAGRDPQTPAAIVCRASQTDQRVVSGPLASLPALAAEQKLPAPALIVLGSTVSLMDRIKP